MILTFQIMLLIAMVLTFFVAVGVKDEIGQRSTAICLASIAAFAFSLWVV